MANNTFTFVGNLGIGKKTEKFNPYVESTSKGGWVSRKLNFFVKNPMNFANCEIYGGYSAKNPVIYGFTKGKNGEKGEAIQIPFSERLSSKHIENMAEFKKFVIVLGEERKEYISEYDFAENVKNIINSEKYKDATFKVIGNIVKTEYKGKFYTKYQPTRIYLIEDETEKMPVSEGILEFHYGNDAITDNFEDIKKIFISGYTLNYDSNRKKDIGIPINNIEIDFSSVEDEDKIKRIYNKYLEIFSNEDDEFNKIGLKIRIINGIEEKPFDESMLDEEQLDLIEMGLLDIEDVKKEMGYGKGNKVEAIKVMGLAKGYSRGAVKSGLTLEDYLIEEVDVFDEDKEATNDIGKNNEDDSFDLDLDLDL